MANIKKIATVINEERTEYELKDAVARAFIEANQYQWNVGESPVLYVAKRNSRFTTINDAIEYARTYCTTTNRVLIVIASGMYLEYIDLDDNPGIDFYGMGGVTVRSSVAWRLSTLRCSNDITVYNINFENYYTPATGEHAGYGLHADPVTGVQKFYNCIFFSDNNSAVGIGMGQSGQCNFYNCHFRSVSGGIYAHNNVADGTTGQWLRFYDCSVETIDGSNVIRIDDSASMADSSRRSQMGVVFKNFTGNNHGLTYKYGSPNQIINYIPVDAVNYNIFLYQGSGNNDLIALDPVKQTKAVVHYFTVMGTALWYIPEADAYKYQWEISNIRYRDYNTTAGTWGEWTAFPSSKTITIERGTPDAIKVFIPGSQNLPTATRSFELSLNGKPRASYTFPETIT